MLKVGSGGDKENAADVEHGRAGLLAVLWGSIVAAVFAIIVATQVFASDVAQTFRIGRRGAVSGYDFSFVVRACSAIGHLCRSIRRNRNAHRRIHWLGLARAALFARLTGDLTTAAGVNSRKARGVTKCVSSARARLAFRQSGHC